jgi:hypothetical protein
MFENDTTLLLGPFVGDWESEIITFRPYIKWITSIGKYENIYLSTHSNRAFLYHWIKEENIFPIFGEFSRDELSQHGYIHKELPIRDYNLLVKKFKERIDKKKKIEIFYPNYTKNNPAYYPIYNKIFERIEVPSNIKISNSYKNKIVFIPDIKENSIKTDSIYRALKKEYGEEIIVVGDMKTHLIFENIVFKHPDYIENGYKYILSYINYAKAVICPTSHWSVIANIQGIPLFTWGKQHTQFKENGIYNFGNKCLSYPTDKNTKTEIIIDMVKYFRREYEI